MRLAPTRHPRLQSASGLPARMRCCLDGISTTQATKPVPASRTKPKAGHTARVTVPEAHSMSDLRGGHVTTATRSIALQQRTEKLLNTTMCRKMRTLQGP